MAPEQNFADLLPILACPKCKGPVELKADNSAFVCDACRLAYAIEDGIPNFLIEDAKPLEGASGG